MGRYTDNFRATALVMLESFGYPERLGALMKAANHLGVPESTLRTWYKGQNMPSARLRDEKKGELTALVQNEMYAILDQMDDSRAGATYSQLATAFGILFDKNQLLTGGATENVNNRIVVNIDDHDS